MFIIVLHELIISHVNFHWTQLHSYLSPLALSLTPKGLNRVQERSECEFELAMQH